MPRREEGSPSESVYSEQPSHGFSYSGWQGGGGGYPQQVSPGCSRREGGRPLGNLLTQNNPLMDSRTQDNPLMHFHIQDNLCRDMAWAWAGHPGGLFGTSPLIHFRTQDNPLQGFGLGPPRSHQIYPKCRGSGTLVKTCTRKLTTSVLELRLRRNTFG